MRVLRRALGVLVISFGVVLILLVLSRAFLLIFMIPLVPLLLIAAGRALVLRKTGTGIEILAMVAGISLAFLAWGDWNFDLTGLQLRSQAVLRWHIQRHPDREQASQLWRKVQAVVEEARRSGNPGVRDKASWKLLSMVSAVEEGWILQGVDEELGAGMKVDLVWVKEDPQLAGGARVLVLAQIAGEGRPQEVVEWLKVALGRIDSFQNAARAQLAAVGYLFEKPQNNANLSEVIAELQAQFGDTSNPIVIAWTDAGGEDHVVCVGCNDRFTLEDAKRPACQQKGICAGIVQTPEEFLREYPPSPSSQTSGGGIIEPARAGV